ncbi:AAA domain-containing protein [Streptosporangium sp. NPDC049304]|uniref:serine/threonine-protein kinase n=1 Tax=Streptosporangium sp. NPDC049304 TaxID=3154830 RepID=UPI00342929BD
MIGDRYVPTKDAARHGGHAEVLKATDTYSGTPVAIKFVQGVPDQSITELFFERETSALRAVSHPNIVQLLDSGWDSGRSRYFLVLEWMETSLSDDLKKHGAFTWFDLVEQIALPLADALAHAHLSEVAHRDIKPQNVLLSQEGRPRLADFGIAKLRNQLQSGVTVADFRSEPYAPPERDDSEPYVRDVYAYGVLLIQCLTDIQLRSRGDVEEALNSVDVPPDIRRLLEECVSTTPDERPANGSVLFERLRRVHEADAARRKARANVIWLKTSRKVERQLLEETELVDDRRAAEARLLVELSDGPHAEFRFDHISGVHDEQTVHLIGREYQFVLKFDEYDPAFVVIAAYRKDEDWLERARNRAYSIGQTITWTCAVPPDLDQTFEAGNEFLDQLHTHVETSAEAAGIAKNRQQADGLFDGWLNLLDAREDLARGSRQPLEYRECKLRGREATFQLTQPTNHDLLAEEWEVHVPNIRRTFGRGEVIAQNENTVTLRLYRTERSLPEKAQLVPYLGPTKKALQRQREAVAKIKDGNAVRSNLRELLLDPSSSAAPEPFDVDRWRREDLDESKRRAVNYALGAKDMFLIQGPPGTGKTSVITEIISQFLERQPNSRILLVSQTHVALDNALERLNAVGMHGLVRLGQPEDPRIDSSIRPLMLDRQMELWANQVRKRAEKHLSEEAARDGISDEHLRAALKLQQLSAVMDELDVVERHIANSSSVTSNTDLATGLGLTNDVGDLLERRDRLRERTGELLAEARGFVGSDLTLRDTMSQVEARHAVDALLMQSSNGHRLLSLLQLQAEWLQRLASDEHLAVAFLRTTRVVAGTCLGFLGHPAVRDLDFDLCILDEASKATATEALVPLARARQWILIGDTSQLPPMDEDVLRNEQLISEYQLDPEFVKTTLFGRLVQATEYPVKHMLTEQYRMIRPIGDLISTCFYDGDLKSPKRDSIKGLEHFGRPVLWIDTKNRGTERFEESIQEGASISNRTEAQLVVDRVQTLDNAVARGIIQPPKGQRLNVLLIAPYRRQIDEIKRRIASNEPKHLDVNVQSVDAVQGKEADIAIFSVTRSNQRGKMGFLGYAHWRRINVALSRARYGMTIVGDADFCSASPGALKEVLDYMKQHPDDCEIREA